MDDQFNVRTDDDLFLDDFEPVAADPVPSAPPPALETPTILAPPPSPPPQAFDSRPSNPTPRKARAPPSPAQAPESRPPRGQLGQSRHAPPSLAQPSRGGGGGGRGQRGRGGGAGGRPHAQPTTPVKKAAPAEAPTSQSPVEASQPTESTHGAAEPDLGGPPPNALTGPAAAAAATPAHQSAVKPVSVTSEARLKSGANPRTKLTDEELSAKMAAMAVASAEKMRRHNQAQRDERDHEMAMARSAEDARKRRALEQEKRRQADEDRRRLEDERAKNRARKLQAMGAKDGGWEQEPQQQDERRAFTGGANGGVRGVKSFHTGRLIGLEGTKNISGYNSDDENDGGRAHHQDTAAASGAGGRGGRSGRGRGRGGNGGEGRGGGGRGSHNAPAPARPAINNDAEFPPLSKNPPKVPAVGVAKQGETAAKMFSPLSPNARWDDEVEAEDERAKASKQQSLP